jgi:hypothetical protein
MNFIARKNIVFPKRFPINNALFHRFSRRYALYKKTDIGNNDIAIIRPSMGQ